MTGLTAAAEVVCIVAGVGGIGGTPGIVPVDETSVAQAPAVLQPPHCRPQLQHTHFTTHLISHFSFVTGTFTSTTFDRTRAHVGSRTGQQCSQPLQSLWTQCPTTRLGPGTQKSSHLQVYS